MLITKTVMMKWNGRNKKWFVDKGYIYTKIGEEFEVKIEDLSNSSDTLVEIKCDSEDCKNPFLKLVRWVDYKQSVKEDGKYYCHKCALKLYANENSRKTKLKNGTSFKQWCVENNRQDILDRWDYELNDCLPREILFSTHKKYYFKCSRKLHNSELKCISDFTSGHNGVMDCKVCNSFAQWGIDNIGEDFLEKYWDYEMNKINPWEISRGNKTKKIFIKCQEKNYHGSYDVLCNSFTCRGSRCNYCGNFKIHILDSLGTLYPETFVLWSDKNKKSPYEYSPRSGEYAWWKCPDGKHKDYKRIICGAIDYNFRCSACTRERDESFLQEYVRLYLNNLEYDVLHETNCTLYPKNIVKHKAMKKTFRLRYDNEIIINNEHLVIEVNGIQHYKISSLTKKQSIKYNTTQEYELWYQQEKDKYKKEFAVDNGYFYLEIPYWTNDKDETWKKMIDEKIKGIKNIL